LFFGLVSLRATDSRKWRKSSLPCKPARNAHAQIFGLKPAYFGAGGLPF
jgi:hypothetical protein